MAENLPSRPESSDTPGSPPGSVNDTMTGGLSRPAVERVLARAAELHNAADFGDPSDALSEARLLEITRDVGLSTASVRQALAEERTRVAADVTDESGWLARVAGPGIVSATRTVRGTPADVMASLDTWMQREECLRVQRRFPDRIVWERSSDWFNTIRRTLRLGGRAYQLHQASQVSTTVIPVDDAHVLVRLDADVIPRRTAQVRIGAVAGSGGVALSGTFLVLGAVAHAAVAAVALAAIIPIGLGGVAAYAVIRRHQQLAGRVRLALEQALDRLEFTEPGKPATLLDVVAAIRPLVR